MERAYRRATAADADFLVPALVAAERSGAERSMYERVFGLDGDGLAELFAGLLAEDVPGSELCCESFWVALEGRDRVGCIATWVEADGGPSSAMVRASLLPHALGAERWRAATEALRALSAIDIPRAPGALQIEAVYAHPAHRGRGVVGGLLAHALADVAGASPAVERAQILSVSGNDPSARAFEKAGFRVVRRAESDDPRVAALFPGRGRLLWERAIRLSGE